MFEQDAEKLMNMILGLRKINKDLNNKPLPFREMSVLGMLKMNEDIIQMSEISSNLEMTKPALSQLINKLEDAELVERIFQKSDRRATYIKITEKGNKLFEGEREKFRESLKNILARMGEKDSKEFIRLTGEFLNAFNQERGVQ